MTLLSFDSKTYKRTQNYISVQFSCLNLPYLLYVMPDNTPHLKSSNFNKNFGNEYLNFYLLRTLILLLSATKAEPHFPFLPPPAAALVAADCSSVVSVKFPVRDS